MIGVPDPERVELARAAKFALEAYAEGYGTFAEFRSAADDLEAYVAECQLAGYQRLNDAINAEPNLDRAEGLPERTAAMVAQVHETQRIRELEAADEQTFDAMREDDYQSRPSRDIAGAIVATLAGLAVIWFGIWALTSGVLR